MIDSAITPEPIVATVRFESDDMRRSIGVTGGQRGVVAREIHRPRAVPASKVESRLDRGADAGRVQSIGFGGSTGPPDRREPVAGMRGDRLLVLVLPLEEGRRQGEYSSAGLK
jgi:hypothetical protein